MCTISSQKCVSFVFLVVLAVLSCSGFRIDNLAMTDISKRNSIGTQQLGLLEALSTHKLRHRRHMQDAKQSKRRPTCPEVDPSWKAFMADAVAVASVESKSYKCKGNCTVQFKINEWLKKATPYNDELVRTNFRTDRNNECESDDPKTNLPFFLVKNSSKRVILFLKTNGPHHYTAAFSPEPYKTKTFKTVKRVNDHRFKPKPIVLEQMLVRNNNHKRLRIQCRVKGFPIPLITWKVNNSQIHPDFNRTRITQKKRKSTLLIRNLKDEDWGRYECVVRKPDGAILRQFQTIPKPDRGPCEKMYESSYCLNGGTCFYTASIREMSCECPPGFQGRLCEEKSSNQFSRYRQTPISICNVGLYTRLDEC